MRNLKDMTIAVDASVVAYQSALGMKSINALTDSNGNPTIHINVVIAKCLNFKKCKINQVWVFDFHEKGYINPSKTFELDKRKKIKDNAQKKLKDLHDLHEKNKDDLFSSDDDLDDTENKDSIESKIHTQEKIGFSLNDKIINDIKFILDCFDISWCESPKGYEAEAICAFLTDDTNEQYGDDAFCDVVWTTDTDAIIYGAKQIVRELKIKQKKKLMLYELDTILTSNELNMEDLRKIAVVAGCDHCAKTPKVGAKTILKKFKTVELTESQNTAIKVFKKNYDISKLNWYNFDNDSFENTKKITKLLNWLEVKNFNRDRVQKQIEKALV
jgi:5'-3' exonuclease